MILASRPRIEEVCVQRALTLPDGRTPVLVRLSGWGFAWIGGTRRWFWGPQTWRALVPVPGAVEIRLRNLWGGAAHSTPLPGSGPATPRIAAPDPRIHVSLRAERLQADLRLPPVPQFTFSPVSKEPSHE